MEKYTAEDIDRAFARLGKEIERERAQTNSSARKARDRMIRRMGKDKENSKVDGNTSATDKIPIWSN